MTVTCSDAGEAEGAPFTPLFTPLFTAMFTAMFTPPVLRSQATGGMGRSGRVRPAPDRQLCATRRWPCRRRPRRLSPGDREGGAP